MSYYREKGKYYDVPADDIDLTCKTGYEQPEYDAMRYMDKQRKFAKKTRDQIGREEYSDSRYK